VETLIHVRMARSGLRVVEVPSYEASRLHGVSNLHALRDGWRVLKTIIIERFTALHRAEPGRQTPEIQEAWDGVERRTGGDRRSGGDRRQGPRVSFGRRRGYARRSTDPQPTTAVSTQTLLQQGMPV
jgi:hypothetical protein